MGALIRHSERFFTDDAQMEPFMTLTENGKNHAFNFGAGMRPDLSPGIFTSFMGRCIETAFLIDKGFSNAHNQKLDHPKIHPLLSPFYVTDVRKAVPLIKELGNDRFLRKWFDGRLNEDIMMPPEKAVKAITKFMIATIKSVQNHLIVCVSHDWNIFPVKEFILDRKHEIHGNIGFLDGLIYFEQDRQWFVTMQGIQPVALEG